MTLQEFPLLKFEDTYNFLNSWNVISLVSFYFTVRFSNGEMLFFIILGISYKKDGSQLYWRGKDKTRYNKRVRCLIKQYNNFTVPDTDGLKVLSLQCVSKFIQTIKFMILGTNISQSYCTIYHEMLTI